MPEKAWWRGILIKRKKQKTEQIPSLINHLNFFIFFGGEKGGRGNGIKRSFKAHHYLYTHNINNSKHTSVKEKSEKSTHMEKVLLPSFQREQAKID